MGWKRDTSPAQVAVRTASLRITRSATQANPDTAVADIRISEAIGLDRDDLDLNAGRLLVRHGKFDMTRELILHPSTSDALRRYLADQTGLAPPPRTAAFFVSTAGTRLLYRNVQRGFQQLVRAAGLTPRSGSCRPRIHDLRHILSA